MPFSSTGTLCRKDNFKLSCGLPQHPCDWLSGRVAGVAGNGLVFPQPGPAQACQGLAGGKAAAFCSPMCPWLALNPLALKPLPPIFRAIKGNSHAQHGAQGPGVFSPAGTMPEAPGYSDAQLLWDENWGMTRITRLFKDFRGFQHHNLQDDSNLPCTLFSEH